MPSAAHPLVPTWRTEPHRLLFPLGAGLATFAVLPFTARGVGGGSLALFHSVAQIQGFLTCFLAGLLFTLVPRLTRTAPAEGWEVASALVLPTFAVLSAWVGDAALASRIWLVLVAIVIAFAIGIPAACEAYLFSAKVREPSFYVGLRRPSLRSVLRRGIA